MKEETITDELDLNNLYDSSEENIMKDYVDSKREEDEKIKQEINKIDDDFYEDEESIKMLKIINSSAEIERNNRIEKYRYNKRLSNQKKKKIKLKIIGFILIMLIINIAIYYSFIVRSNV